MKYRLPKYLSSFLSLGIVFYSILASSVFVQPVEAVECYWQPAVWGGAITNGKVKNPNYDDLSEGGGMSFNPGQGVSYGFDANLKSYNYSQIFWNYYNLLTPFVTVDETAAIAKYGEDRWKTKCIDTKTISKGKLTFETNGTISRQDCTYTPVESAGAWRWDLSCNGVDTPFQGITDSQEINVPYVQTIRQIARAIPPIIHTGPWYCNTATPNFCADKYNLPDVDCQVTDLSTYPNPPDGADGICVFRTPKDKNFIADILCAEPTANGGAPAQPIQYPPLESNVCALGDTPDIIFQDPTSTDSEPGTPAGPGVAPVSFSTKPYLSAGTFDNKTNELPFDQDAIEQYYKPALYDKLGLYSGQDRKWLDSQKKTRIDGSPEGLPAAFDIGGDVSGVNRHGPFEMDFVSELGADVEISNDYRFANAELLPTGYGVTQSGVHRAYLRGEQGRLKGTVFVDGKPLGARPLRDGSRLDDPQEVPALHQQVKGQRYSVATIAGKQLYVSISDEPDFLSPFAPVPGYGDIGYEHFALYTFVNSKGSVIVFYPLGGSGAQKYTYTISYDGGKSWTPKEKLPVQFPFNGAFAIDELDGIHVLGADEGGGNLYYSKFYFGDTGLTNIVPSRPVPLNADGMNLKTGGYDSRPFTVQARCALSGTPSGSFNSCFADIAAAVTPVGRNTLNGQVGVIHTTYVTNGNVFTKPEFAVRRSIDYERGLLKYAPGQDAKDMLQYDLGSRRFAESSNSAIARIGDTTVIVYRFLNYSGFIQMQYAYKNGSNGRWEQGLPLSGKVSRAQDGGYGWGGFQGINITPEGLVSFSIIEAYTKYYPDKKMYDPPGYKMCLLPHFTPGLTTTSCGPGKEDGIKYVVAPTQTGSKDIELADPVDPQWSDEF